MSATTTVASQALAEWVRIFPKQMTETYTSSVTFMKQLTVVALSTITYLKNVFPEDSFTTETFGGIRLRVLKHKCRDELAQFVTTALTQAFEAFDKKYLHQLVICFYEGECKVENLIEYHVFEYTYNPDGVTMNLHSKTRDSVKHSMKYAFDSVKEKTLHLIRACVVIMQACQNNMPDAYEISLRLYYNDNAPDGYQAPGFLSTLEVEDHIEATFNNAVKLGSVETPFHKLVARSYIKDAMGSSNDVIPSQNPPMMTQNDHVFTSPSTDQRNMSEVGELQVRCPCNKNDLEELATDMIQCTHCLRWQHAACFGLQRAARHCCAHCSDQDPARDPSDARLASLTNKKRECLSIFRRALLGCSRSSSVSAQQLSSRYGLSHIDATKLMKLLHSHGIVLLDSDADLVTPRKIIQEQVKVVMSNFFQPDEPDIVDRLLVETLSQGSQPDPVGDVLSPLEKVSLQNASSVGRVIEPTTSKVIEDSTLKQYREAILSNEQRDEELPLSGSHNPVKDMEKIGKKRKMSNGEEKRSLRSGVKSKKAKGLPNFK